MFIPVLLAWCDALQAENVLLTQVLQDWKDEAAEKADDAAQWMREANAHCKIAEEIRAENTRLRGIIARSPLPCIYCGLTNIAECARGFPGCGRADDITASEGAPCRSER
jgi:hypothetical protein